MAFSRTGLFYLLVLFVFWLIFFDPRAGRTPEATYFFLLTTVFGGMAAFFAALSAAGRANRAESYPILVRLPSRIEFLTAVLLAALLFVLLLQGVVSGVILLMPGSPRGEIGRLLLLEAPPVWISLNIFAAVLGLHTADLVVRGWSRAVVYGVLVLVLFGQGSGTRTNGWLYSRLQTWAAEATMRSWWSLAEWLQRISRSVVQGDGGLLAAPARAVLWPFTALAEALRTGSYTNAQALAPAILLLAATLLFLIAADLFGRKDLQLTE
jgi:hypothetical protein